MLIPLPDGQINVCTYDPDGGAELQQPNSHIPRENPNSAAAEDAHSEEGDWYRRGNFEAIFRDKKHAERAARQAERAARHQRNQQRQRHPPPGRQVHVHPQDETVPKVDRSLCGRVGSYPFGRTKVKVCEDYVNGYCRWGCRADVQFCHNYKKKGWCDYGVWCKRAHSRSPRDQPPSEARARGVPAYPYVTGEETSAILQFPASPRGNAYPPPTAVRANPLEQVPPTFFNTAEEIAEIRSYYPRFDPRFETMF